MMDGVAECRKRIPCEPSVRIKQAGQLVASTPFIRMNRQGLETEKRTVTQRWEVGGRGSGVGRGRRKGEGEGVREHKRGRGREREGESERESARASERARERETDR